jgi:hypothetical protein
MNGWIDKKLEGKVSGMFRGTILAFAWRRYGKPQKSKSGQSETHSSSLFHNNKYNLPLHQSVKLCYGIRAYQWDCKCML